MPWEWEGFGLVFTQLDPHYTISQWFINSLSPVCLSVTRRSAAKATIGKNIVIWNAWLAPSRLHFENNRFWKFCVFATTQMHVNSVSSPERMIAAWQAMHKVIWSTTSYIFNCYQNCWRNKEEIPLILAKVWWRSSILARYKAGGSNSGTFVTVTSSSLLMKLSRHWSL